MVIGWQRWRAIPAHRRTSPASLNIRTRPRLTDASPTEGEGDGVLTR